MITIEQVHDLEVKSLFQRIQKFFKEESQRKNWGISLDLSLIITEICESLFKKNEKIREILYIEGLSQNYLGGLRTIVKQSPSSFLYHNVSDMFKLVPIFNNVTTWGKHIGSLSRVLNIVEKEYRAYTQNVVAAANIMEEYDPMSRNIIGSDNAVFIEDPRVRTYATYKTWIEDARYEEYMKNIIDLFDIGFEVFIEGPITLYVKMTKEEIVCLLRLVSTSLNPQYEHGEMERLLPLFLHEIIKSESQDGGYIDSTLILLKDALRSAVMGRVGEEDTRRAFIQKWDDRKKYLYTYEGGKFFKDG